MKKLFIFLFFYGICNVVMSQQQTFDLATFTPPPGGGWKKQNTESVIQFTKEDAAKGTYCLITLYKAIPGNTDSKENFDLAWETLVKEMVTVTAKPAMQPAATENGWEAQSGFSPFENDGSKGIALLVTSSGFEKMVNIIILTNTDAYQTEMSAFLESITLNKPTGTAKQPDKPAINTVKPPPQTSVPKKDGFAFNTSNFDDGWTSTVQEDWVEVTKGNIKVLLHYPKEGTIFPADPDPLTRAAWNILVAPRYSNLKNFKTTYISSYERPYIGHGYATNNSTGKEVYVVLFRQGQTGWIEIIAPEKNSFIQYFKVDPDAIRWDSESALMNPMIQMVNYNKFAIAAGDFKGTWTSDFTGVQQLYNVYTGNYAGMNINQSNQTFQFGAGNTYNWSILAVNGMVGNIKYANVKSTGKFSVLNNWQVNFSDIEGKPKKFNAFFSCIKGARLLKLLDADYPGSGIYTVFGKK
ncbi:MAG TPA: hypothetical protein VN451_08875 [Chitinophagaceae bacterium]|nr:hypothetical protein [Chitinophagaceae bacterium]